MATELDSAEDSSASKIIFFFINLFLMCLCKQSSIFKLTNYGITQKNQIEITCLMFNHYLLFVTLLIVVNLIIHI